MKASYKLKSYKMEDQKIVKIRLIKQTKYMSLWKINKLVKTSANVKTEKKSARLLRYIQMN